MQISAMRRSSKESTIKQGWNRAQSGEGPRVGIEIVKGCLQPRPSSILRLTSRLRGSLLTRKSSQLSDESYTIEHADSQDRVDLESTLRTAPQV